MKYTISKITALVCVLLVFTGCVRVVNEVRPGSGNMDIAGSDATGDSGTEGGARDDGETPARTGRAESGASEEDASGGEEGSAERVRLVLSEDTYDEVKLIAASERFAVRDGAVWGVVDANGREVHPPEYDFIETDGSGLYSLSKKNGTAFDARLMYYDAKSGREEELFTNEQYAEYDFTAIYSPYITMTTRGADKLNVMYVDVGSAGAFDLARLSRFDRNAVLGAGMDASKWEAVSGFMGNMTSDGGSFVSSRDWAPDGTGYSNAVGVDGANQIVLSEIERDRTIRMLPYAADDEGFYAAGLVELPSEKETLSYGNLKDHDIAAAGLKAFPSGTVEVIPDVSSGTERAGRSGRAVISDADHDKAIFNMNTGKAETEFRFQSVFLAGDNRYPSVARENKTWKYITPDGETRDGEFASASLYDEQMGYAVVAGKNGNLYAIDRNGNRASAEEEGFEDSAVAYLNGEDSHAFAVTTDGKVRICVLRNH